MALLNKLAEFPDMLAHAADELAPHAVAFYLRDLAGEFHSFYNDRAERVLVDECRAQRTRRASCRHASGAGQRSRDDRRLRSRQDVSPPA